MNFNEKVQKKDKVQIQIEPIKATEKFDYNKIHDDNLNGEDMVLTNGAEQETPHK